MNIYNEYIDYTIQSTKHTFLHRLPLIECTVYVLLRQTTFLYNISESFSNASLQSRHMKHPSKVERRESVFHSDVAF